MNRGWIVGIAVISVLTPSVPGSAQKQRAQITATGGIAINGNVNGATLNVTGLSPGQARALIDAGNRKWINLSGVQRKELTELQKQLGVTMGALQTFFSILGQSDARTQDLPRKLSQIAQQFLNLQQQLRESPQNQADILGLRQEALTALNAGQFGRADHLLQRIEDIQDKALATSLADRAATAERRGTLAMTQLRYNDASEHFAAAARSAIDIPSRSRYLDQQANALYFQGDEQGDNAALAAAIELRRVAIDRPALDPLARARAQYEFGAALALLGERETNTIRLEQAEEAFRAALSQFTRTGTPLDWAMTQNGLGMASATLGERRGDVSKLKSGIAAFEASMSAYNRNTAPLDWALARYNLAASQVLLGEREESTELLMQAVLGFQDVLLIFNREHYSFDWAMVQNAMGSALTKIGERENNPIRLEEAISAQRLALLECDRSRFPLDWAQIKYYLAYALAAKGERESGIEKLSEAVAVYREALLEARRDRVPLDWTAISLNMAAARAQIAIRTGDRWMLRSAKIDAIEARKTATAWKNVSLIKTGTSVIAKIAKMH